MEKKEWVNEAKKIMIDEYGFDEKFALETAEHNYECNKEQGDIEEYTVRELIETELSYWGD